MITNILNTEQIVVSAFDSQIRRMKKIQALMENSWNLRKQEVRETLATIIAGREKIKAHFHVGQDPRKARGAEWQYNHKKGLWRMFKVFNVTENLEWQKPCGIFEGDWLKVSREELCREIGCSLEQLKKLVKDLKKSKVLDFKIRWCPEISTTVWWLRLNPWRLDTLIKRALKVNRAVAARKGYKNAKKIRIKAGGRVVRENTKIACQIGASVEGAPESVYPPVLDNCTHPFLPSRLHTEKHGTEHQPLSTEALMPIRPIKKGNIMALGSSMKDSICPTGSQETDSVRPVTRLARPTSARPVLRAEATLEISQETYQVVQHLKRVMDTEFTLDALWQLECLVTRQLPARRLTAKKAAHYVDFYWGGLVRELQITDLQFFIDHWPKINRDLHYAMHSTDALEAWDTLQDYTNPDAWLHDLEREARSLAGIVRNSAVVEHGHTSYPVAMLWTDCRAESAMELSKWLAVWMLGLNPASVLSDRVGQLARFLEEQPEWYRFLTNKLPLREWAKLSRVDCDSILRCARYAHWQVARTANLVPLSNILARER